MTPERLEIAQKKQEEIWDEERRLQGIRDGSQGYSNPLRDDYLKFRRWEVGDELFDQVAKSVIELSEAKIARLKSEFEAL